MVNLLLADDKLRERIGEAAYKTVVEKFSWEKIAQKFEKLYEQTKGKEKVPENLPLDDFFKRMFSID